MGLVTETENDWPERRPQVAVQL